MTLPKLTITSVPTGGVMSIGVSGAVSGAALLERMVSGAAFAPIYSGAALDFYLDIGDGLPAPLDATLFYRYRYTDSGGTVTSPYNQPASIISLELEPLTQILIRVLQGAINSVTLPDSIRKAQVMHAMPLGGQIPFPLLVLNLDLFQQVSTAIGQSAMANVADAGGYTATGLARRTYRVSTLSPNALERDFYRDTVVGLFQAIWATVLAPLGLDVTHGWQVASGQVADDRVGKAPGFYFADMLLTFEGTLNVTISPVYGLIDTITATVTAPDGTTTEADVPFS